jgi:hypothetical protein
MAIRKKQETENFSSSGGRTAAAGGGTAAAGGGTAAAGGGQRRAAEQRRRTAGCATDREPKALIPVVRV